MIMGTSILTCEEVRRCEALAVAGGLSMAELMRRAGEACAQALMRLFPTGRVLVLCGPGNNGGDALVAAATLREAGRSVEVFESVARAGSAERAGAKALWGGSANLSPILSYLRKILYWMDFLGLAWGGLWPESSRYGLNGSTPPGRAFWLSTRPREVSGIVAISPVL